MDSKWTNTKKNVNDRFEQMTKELEEKWKQLPPSKKLEGTAHDRFLTGLESAVHLTDLVQTTIHNTATDDALQTKAKRAWQDNKPAPSVAQTVENKYPNSMPEATCIS